MYHNFLLRLTHGPTVFYEYAATVESADIPITLQANETIDYKFLPYDKFCDFIQSETFADSIRERFPAYQNALETYVKQVLKDATCKNDGEKINYSFVCFPVEFWCLLC